MLFKLLVIDVNMTIFKKDEEEKEDNNNYE